MSHADAIDEFPEPEFFEGAPPKPSDCMLALIAHLGGLFASFVLPAILMMTQQDKSPYIVRHAREAVNFQLSLFLHSLFVFVPASIVYAVFYFNDMKTFVALLVASVVALLIAIPMTIAEIYFVVRACMAALKGRDYRYPLTIRLI